MEKGVPDYRKLNNPASRGSRDVALVGTLDSDPLSVEEARAREDWPEWKKAMDKEIGQLTDLGTYDLVDLPDGRAPVSCKWVFRLKRNEKGEVVSHKARLVARGFTQIPGIDYSETFAPVMRLETLRILLALAAKCNLKAHVVDVKGAYLNAKLKEDIYMMQPPGYKDGTGKVCKLNLSLYGLKQAGREWNIELDGTFAELGYTRLFADQCVYYREKNEELGIVGVHVDDMGILASTDEAMKEIKEELGTKFEISDMGELKQIVSLEVTRDWDEGTITLSQSQYIKRVLERYGMEDSRPVKMPMDPRVKLTKTPPGITHEIPQYAAAIGSLMYAAIGTRPDISYAVQCLSQFTSNPSPEHWTAVKRVLRYLNGTRDQSITYTRDTPIELSGYANADWGSNPDDRKSITGYVFRLGDEPITWSARKQPTIALSSMEAETMALSSAAREAIWLRNLLTELGFAPQAATTIYADNQAAISFAHNSGLHGRSKHIEIQHLFVREKIISGEINVTYCSTTENLADLLTKGLPQPRHEKLLEGLHLTQPELRGSVEVEGKNTKEVSSSVV
ncbi:hypothetical protein ONZ45_g17438 [Pleurotus djamor]|nr:hypothetical protein ONZ45_g17438 [Pleurotus djamor]